MLGLSQAYITGKGVVSMGTIEFYCQKAREAKSIFELHIIRGLMFESAWNSTLHGHPVTQEMLAPFFESYGRRDQELMVSEEVEP